MNAGVCVCVWVLAFVFTLPACNGVPGVLSQAERETMLVSERTSEREREGARVGGGK